MSVVDLTSRRPRRRVGGIVAAGLLLVAGAGAGVWAWRSGAVDTRVVSVAGVERSDAAAVASVTDPLLGVPVPLVDTGDVEARLTRLPLVLDADVRRAWPTTIEVRITERQPAAAVPTPTGYALVDMDAVVVATAAQPPPELPVITTDLVTGDEGVRAALSVLASLPAELRSQVSATTVVSAADVRLVVAGKDVRWGGAEDAEAKGNVLTALLAGVEAGVYDVSAPAAPATRP